MVDWGRISSRSAGAKEKTRFGPGAETETVSAVADCGSVLASATASPRGAARRRSTENRSGEAGCAAPDEAGIERRIRMTSDRMRRYGIGARAAEFLRATGAVVSWTRAALMKQMSSRA